MIALPRLSSRAVALAAVAGLQTLAVAWMVVDRLALLAHGREITAAVVPVDPRDLFRGDYVTLSYGFSTGGEIALPAGVRQGDTVYALLKNRGPSEWELAAVSGARPDAAGDGEVVLKAIVDRARRGGAGDTATLGRLRYGIERYYVPEGSGRSLEKQVRDKRIEAVLAVGANGKVAIKGLKVDGTLVAEQPWL